jgi:hypothetical protein
MFSFYQTNFLLNLDAHGVKCNLTSQAPMFWHNMPKNVVQWDIFFRYELITTSSIFKQINDNTNVVQVGTKKQKTKYKQKFGLMIVC